jgi:hypothetical protein
MNGIAIKYVQCCNTFFPHKTADFLLFTHTAVFQNVLQRSSICVVAGFQGNIISILHKCLIFAQNFNLPQNPAIIAYTMLWAGFYLFCSISAALTASWSNLFQAPVAASIITGINPPNTSNTIQPAPTFVLTTLVTDS